MAAARANGASCVAAGAVSIIAPMFSRLLTSVGQLVLPVHCAACGAAAPTDRRWPLCEACGREMADLIASPYCPLCGRRAGPHTVGPDGCMFCRKYPVRFSAAVRVGPYEGPLKALILRCKYERRPAIAGAVGRLLRERLALAPWADQVDLVVPVPLHWSRQISRGFNQALAVARHLAGAAPKARGVSSRLLRRTRPTPHQTDLPAARRRKNVRSAFAARGKRDAIKGKGVLLVDDVMTSGTTIGECTRVLRRAGARDVYVAVVATADYDEVGPW